MKKGRKKISIASLIDDETRQNIWLELIDNSKLSITQLEERLKINRGTLKHHLNILESNGIISSVREDHLAGKPRLFFRKQRQQNDKLIKEIFDFINNKKRDVSQDEIIDKFKNYGEMNVILEITFLEIDDKIKKFYKVNNQNETKKTT